MKMAWMHSNRCRKGGSEGGRRQRKVRRKEGERLEGERLEGERERSEGGKDREHEGAGNSCVC